MPIYEYESLESDRACKKCANRFEIIQKMEEKTLTVCPSCGQKVRKVPSCFRAAVIESCEEHVSVEKKIGEYEKRGMWSHAAELADKHSEKIKDKNIKMRALDNYNKAGYDAGSLKKYLKE